MKLPVRGSITASQKQTSCKVSPDGGGHVSGSRAGQELHEVLLLVRACMIEHLDHRRRLRPDLQRIMKEARFLARDLHNFERLFGDSPLELRHRRRSVVAHVRKVGVADFAVLGPWEG